jgi:transcriptional regulator with XRE-family HTH domain
LILIYGSKIREWLKLTRRSQVWLAKRMGIGRAYLHRIITNDCKIYTDVIERLLTITGFSFEELFYFDGKEDTREFYGTGIKWLGKYETKKKYLDEINAILKKKT